MPIGQYRSPQFGPTLGQSIFQAFQSQQQINEQRAARQALEQFRVNQLSIERERLNEQRRASKAGERENTLARKQRARELLVSLYSNERIAAGRNETSVEVAGIGADASKSIAETRTASQERISDNEIQARKDLAQLVDDTRRDLGFAQIDAQTERTDLDRDIFETRKPLIEAQADAAIGQAEFERDTRESRVGISNLQFEAAQQQFDLANVQRAANADVVTSDFEVPDKSFFVALDSPSSPLEGARKHRSSIAESASVATEQIFSSLGTAKDHPGTLKYDSARFEIDRIIQGLSEGRLIERDDSGRFVPTDLGKEDGGQKLKSALDQINKFLLKDSVFQRQLQSSQSEDDS